MAEQFAVDLAWLEQLVARLGTGADTASRAFEALHETGPIRTGHKSLDTACDKFQKSCSKAVKDLRKQLDTLGEGVKQAKASYGATEHAVTQTFASPGAPLTGQPSITQVLG